MNISNISQRLALATFDLNDDYLEKSRKKWSERREYLYIKVGEFETKSRYGKLVWYGE